MSLGALSIDLDECDCYEALHGVGPFTGGGPGAVYAVALPRILRFAAARGIPCTLFVVGRDARERGNARLLRSAVREGHEVANHSLDHRYDLTRQPLGTIRQQVSEANAVIAEGAGEWPRGFRAPGYLVTNALLEVLAAERMEYDSSVFPCPPYYVAKLAAVALRRLQGRRSAGVIDSPSVLLAPRRPYRLRALSGSDGAGLVELPIQTVSALRLPFIGTTLTLAGPAVASWLARGLASEPLVNLELHGLDFLDASDGLAALARFQPDLRVPVGRKLAALDAALDQLSGEGRRWVTLREAAAAVR